MRRLKYMRRPVAPSVPCHGQSYGYEERDDGTLKRQLPPESDTTLGPAYYETMAVCDETLLSPLSVYFLCFINA